MSLKEYHRKRDFSRTKEPYGKKQTAKQVKYLFVIQKHAASHLHYDFRLELDGVLKSWAVPKGPSLDPKVKHLAMHVEDHPIDYAHFEGIIPEGEYGGGTVMVWDIGKWEPLDDNVRQAYYNGNLTFKLHGKKLHGVWKLIKIKSTEKGRDQWLLFKVNDEYSHAESEFDIKKTEPLSAESGRSMKQIAEEKKRIWTRKGEVKSKTNKKKLLRINVAKVPGVKKQGLPTVIYPELATLVTAPPQGEDWLHEIKWDGYRLLAKIRNKDVQLVTRRNNDWTTQFPQLARALKSLKFKDVILDGEIVALDDKNKTDFQILQNSMEEKKLDVNLIYYVFDLLYYDGYSLLNLPLIERKKILEKILASKALPDEIKFNDHIIGKGEDVYHNACKYHLEGIVSKRTHSVYNQKRTKDWLKIKCTRRQEFVIGGYTDPKASRQYFGALLLGYYRNKELIYCGRVGTGFTQKSLQEVDNNIKKLKQKTCPFTDFPERISKDIHWLKPKLVAEIEFLEITSDGVLRHPSFKGLRKDKKAEAISLELPKAVEEVEIVQPVKNKIDKLISKIRFTNLDRVLYPQQGLTKLDLINYYVEAADWILPHLKNRPLTLVRCPSGNHKHCFYQKHMNEKVPSFINSVDILEDGKYEPYITIDNIEGLLSLVQMGVLEIHPWGSHNRDVEKPDRITFDLDPAPDVKWPEVIECAFLLRQFLDFLKLKSFVKTTGGKGLHVVIPIKPTLLWEDVRDITKRIADVMVDTHPKKYIATMSKAKRTGKIFIDYLRNARGATAVAAYSTRAKPHAPIATPLSWKELEKGDIKADTFNIKNINQRLTALKEDPWQDFFKTRQSITAKIRKLLLK